MNYFPITAKHCFLTYQNKLVKIKKVRGICHAPQHPYLTHPPLEVRWTAMDDAQGAVSE